MKESQRKWNYTHYDKYSNFYETRRILWWFSLQNMQLILCKCFICLVACVGSGDPVRVLRLYTTITLDEVCSIYCWDICTTCRYRSTCYSTCASGPTALSVCSRLCLVTNCSTENWALIMYCTMPFIATCVDAIGMVFWDRPVLRYPGKALILVAKLLLLL